MDDKRVAAVLFHYFNRGDNHIIDYIMIDKNGEYIRREYNITIKEWLYQLRWYRTTAKSEFECVGTGILCKWYFKNINISTVSDISEYKDIQKISLEFTRIHRNDE